MRLAISKQIFHLKLAEWNLYWALFTPLFLAIVLNFVPVRGLFVVKDIFFYGSIITLIFTGRSFAYIGSLFKILLFIIYLLLVTIIFFDLKPWIVYNLRQLLVPLLIVAFGYNLKVSPLYSQKFIDNFYKALVVVLVIGILIKYLGLWSVIDLTTYFNLKGIPVDSRGLSYMFYEPAFSYVERLASTVLDPISLGHIFACGVILLFYGVAIKGKTRWLIFILILSGLMLTFSKGAFLQVVLAIFFFNKNLDLGIRLVIPLGFVALSLIILNIDGILIHIMGLKNAIVYMNLFGHGLGLVGNYAKMFADDLTIYNQYKISDTFIGAVLGQIGFLGTLFWLSFFSRFFHQVFFKKGIFVGSIVIVSQLVIAALSENTFNFNSFVIPGIIGGVLAYNKI